MAMEFKKLPKFSSSLDGYIYEEEYEELYLLFGTKSYLYTGVKKSVVDNMLISESIGRYVKENIIGKYPSIKVKIEQ